MRTKSLGADVAHCCTQSVHETTEILTQRRLAVKWSTLIRADRSSQNDPSLAKVEVYPGRDEQSHVPHFHAHQADVDRVLYSSAFRRMQGKAQVYMFPPSDYVRTRLTHTLEVENIGRQLTTVILRTMKQTKSSECVSLFEHLDKVGIEAKDLVDSVAAASLAHDIGNPPFGHIGEYAIRSWFEGQFSDSSPLVHLNTIPKDVRSDFVKFDGNAQGFRIINRLQGWRDRGGLQLTYTTLGASIKYPTNSSLAAENKFGYMHSERTIFADVAEKLGLGILASDESGNPLQTNRHPFAYIVEAADDIAYRVTDIEDGVHAGQIPMSEGFALLNRLGNSSDITKDRLAGIEDEFEKIKYLRSACIMRLIGECARVFVSHIDDILEGRFKGSLIARGEKAYFETESRKLSNDYVYFDAEKVRNQAGAYELIHSMLSIFSNLIEQYINENREFERLDDKNKNLIYIIGRGNPYMNADSAYGLYQMLVDFVSGMTDKYALHLYRNIQGNSLSMR